MANTAINKLVVNQEAQRGLTLMDHGNRYDLALDPMKVVEGSLPEGKFACKVIQTNFKKELGKLQQLLTGKSEEDFSRLKFLIELPDGSVTYAKVKTLGAKGLFAQVAKGLKGIPKLETKEFKGYDYIDYKPLFDNKRFMKVLLERLELIPELLEGLEVVVSKEFPLWESQIDLPVTNIWSKEEWETIKAKRKAK